MKRCPPLWYRAAWAALLVSLMAFGAYGQGAQSGNIFGTVVGSDGSALPGVTVTLTGGGAPQTTVTDAQGRFRFINLSPDTYSLRAELAGMGEATRGGITVNIGRNADVTMTLNPSVSQTITVTAEAPLLDTRRTGTGATITEVELEEVPTARDPWVILQQVPGVQMDRINVGGNESGQQSTFVSKGITQDEATYSVDGVNTTDMIATGGSSAYYDFGSFEEMQVTTGGTDPRVQTPGAQINIVTKRGTNDFSGSGRYYLTDGEWQAEPEVPAEAISYLGRPNEISEVTEWGFEVGGPIIRDRLWAWGAYADNQISLFVAQPKASFESGAPRFFDNTLLETKNAKLNAQIMRNNSATFFYVDNQKSKQGRNAGPNRPPETTWNQAGFGPKGTYKLEDTHIFSSNFYLTAMASRVNGGFGLWSNSGKGCADLACATDASLASPTLSLKTGSWRNGFISVEGERPQEQLRLDGSTFFNTGALSHELKFGFGYRTASTTGATAWGPNNQLQVAFDGLFGLPQGFGITYFYAFGGGDPTYEFSYNDIYVGDTMLFGNLTVQAGLRFDTQKADPGDIVAQANLTVPEYLPALTAPAGNLQTMEWKSISPRIGLTYALGEDKRTLLRAAYNNYVGQLGSNTSGYTSTIPITYRYLGFYTMDANGDDVITRDEILFDYGIYGTPYGFDPDNPTSVLGTTRVDSDIDPPTTNEFIIGGEREILRDFVVGVNYTHRKMDNFVGQRAEKTQGAGDWYTSADYELVTTITNPPGTPEASYSIPVYQLKGGDNPVPLPVFGVLTNLPGYTQTYDGLELTAVKRMANRWMLRGNISWNDWRQQVGNEFITDPTPLRVGAGCSNCDDSEVVEQSTGSGNKTGVWVDSDWAVNLAGVYQIPFIEANLGASFTMRQGYPVLYVHTVPGSITREGAKNVLVTDVGEDRLDNPYSLDLRLSKDFRFQAVGFELSVDAFNITNSQTVLQRNAGLARSGFNAEGVLVHQRLDPANRILERQSPRIFRVGARLSF